jgi:hypothetical protein
MPKALFAVLLALVAASAFATALCFRRSIALEIPEPTRVYGSHETNLDVIRRTPLHLGGATRHSHAILSNDLRDILEFLEPHWEVHSASAVLHALRLWGPEVEFPSRPIFPIAHRGRPMGGRDMLQFFQDESTFRQSYVSPPPLFFKSPFGLGATHGGLDVAELTHQNDFLAAAAEISLPLDTVFRWGGSVSTLREIILHSLQFFSLEQEMEFTAVAYAHYLVPGGAWTNRFGETFTLDQVAERLLSQSPAEGSCDGTHLPYALAVLWAANLKDRLLSETVRDRIANRLRYFSAALEKSQGAGGWWDRKWIKERVNANRHETQSEELVRNTGHHLEWIALVPADLGPSNDCITRAVHFLVPVLKSPRVSELPGGAVFDISSHAARSLVLLAGDLSPTELMKDRWRKRTIRSPKEGAGNKVGRDASCVARP